MQMMEYETFVGQPVRYYPLGPTHDSFVGIAQGLYETKRGEPLLLVYLVTRHSSVVVPAMHCAREPAKSLFGYLHHFLVVGPEGLPGIILEEIRTEASVNLHVALDDGSNAVIPAENVERFILQPLC